MAGQAPSESSFGAYLDVIGRLAALAAVLLPATGVLTRVAALEWGPRTDGVLEMAVSQPLGLLVATGWQTLFPVAFIAAVWPTYVLLAHGGYRLRGVRRALLEERMFRDESERELQASIERARTPDDVAAIKKQIEAIGKEINERLDGIGTELSSIEKLRPEWTKRFNLSGPMWLWKWLLPTIGALVVLALVVFEAGWATLSGVAIAALALAIFEVAGRRARPLSVGRAWPWLVSLLVVGSILNGLVGSVTGGGARTYHFASGTALADGRYAPLAQEGDMLLLQSCMDSRRPIVGVHSSAVELVQIGYRPLPASLWEVITARKAPAPLGRESFC